MGKRTKAKTGKVHPKRPRDLWPTIDPKAASALWPHLASGVRYAEPMAGDGSLIRLLGPRLTCVWASDLKPEGPDIVAQDVFEWDGVEAVDVIITNPPWTRPILHRLIVHLSDIAPTWLLFDADWFLTGQATQFAPRLRRVVTAGRLVWMPGTTNGGFTACAWHLFDRPRPGNIPLVFPPHYPPPESDRRLRRVCPDCGVLIDRFARWRLQPRNGVPAPVHLDCKHPSGRPTDTGTPLLDWTPPA